MARHPSLSPSSSWAAKFVEAALRTTGPLALTYVHHPLKWLIRDHLLSLIEEFPSLKPCSDTFIHDDGTTVRLLNASGALPLPLPLPAPLPAAAVEITIWLHQRYPFVPPIVYLASSSGHPFVDPSGAAATPYLQTWQYPHSNLLDLARNLVNVFTLCPPFVALAHSSIPPPRDVGGSLASRREAMDRLYATFSTDMVAFRAQVEEDVGSLMSIQSELKERARAVDCAMDELERERESLRGVVTGMEEWADVVRNWPWANNAVPPSGNEPAPEEAFELEDGGCSGCLLDNEAACNAIDDVVSALDKALQEEAVSLDAYLKQVRALSRQQFFHVAMLRKLQD